MRLSSRKLSCSLHREKTAGRLPNDSKAARKQVRRAGPQTQIATGISKARSSHDWPDAGRYLTLLRSTKAGKELLPETIKNGNKVKNVPAFRTAGLPKRLTCWPRIWPFADSFFRPMHRPRVVLCPSSSPARKDARTWTPRSPT